MPSVALWFFFERAKQRVLLRAGHLRNLLDLHLGYLVGVDARAAGPVRVHGPHYTESFGLALAKDKAQDFDDELHRRVVVVVQEDAEERRLLQTLARLCRHLFVESVLALRHNQILKAKGKNQNRERKPRG